MLEEKIFLRLLLPIVARRTPVPDMQGILQNLKKQEGGCCYGTNSIRCCVVLAFAAKR